MNAAVAVAVPSRCTVSDYGPRSEDTIHLQKHEVEMASKKNINNTETSATFDD